MSYTLLFEPITSFLYLILFIICVWKFGNLYTQLPIIFTCTYILYLLPNIILPNDFLLGLVLSHKLSVVCLFVLVIGSLKQDHLKSDLLIVFTSIFILCILPIFFENQMCVVKSIISDKFSIIYISLLIILSINMRTFFYDFPFILAFIYFVHLLPILAFYCIHSSVFISIFLIIKVLILIILLLLIVVFMTLLERHIIGSIQKRKGPNVIGPEGFFQALADGLKLLTKESIYPSDSNRTLFFMSCVIALVLGFIGWSIVPFGENASLSNPTLGLLYLLAVSSLSVYTIIMSGWASNSKYALIGVLRTTSQMLSYELCISTIILTVFFFTKSLNLEYIVLLQIKYGVWLIFPLGPIAFIYYVCLLAETNRHPFDLPEAESELVAGYLIEFGAFLYSCFAIAEYLHILLANTIFVIIFLGGWSIPGGLFIESYFGISLPYSLYCFVFGIKVAILIILFYIIRAAIPRYRHDQLMHLGWKIFLPFSLMYFLLIVIIFYILGI